MQDAKTAEALRFLEKKCSEPRLINPPRKGKKCLVLDIDATISDTVKEKRGVSPEKYRRP